MSENYSPSDPLRPVETDEEPWAVPMDEELRRRLKVDLVMSLLASAVVLGLLAWGLMRR